MNWTLVAAGAAVEESWLGTASTSATWAVPREREKRGAGILLFAYGAEITLQHFLKEAANAASSFKRSKAGAGRGAEKYSSQRNRRVLSPLGCAACAATTVVPLIT